MMLINYYQKSIWKNVINLFLLANIFCCLLISFRIIMYREVMYLFLVWNLFLAGLPLVFAFCLNYLNEVKANFIVKAMTFSLWLLFVPNSPYIITDLIHLSYQRGAPFWYDGAIVFSAALTGLLMGIISLYMVHDILKGFVNKWISWSAVTLLIGLISFGVYLGRVLRWNSWDIFTRPLSLFLSIYESIFRFSAISMTLVFSSMLFISYLTIYSLLEKKQ